MGGRQGSASDKELGDRSENYSPALLVLQAIFRDVVLTSHT